MDHLVNIFVSGFFLFFAYTSSTESNYKLELFCALTAAIMSFVPSQLLVDYSNVFFRAVKVKENE